MYKNQTTLNNTCFLQELFLESKGVTRCLGSLSKLAQHLKGPIVLTGGLAIGWHLMRNGVQSKKSRLNDIDIVVEDLSELHDSLSRYFLIAHFHPCRERGKILIQLVDAEFGTRIDVFTPTSDALVARLTDSVIGNVACRFVAIEDLLAKLLSIIYPATGNKPVEPKYVEHFRLLSTVAVPGTMRKVWLEYRKEEQPLDYEEAAKIVSSSLRANPALLQAEHYCQDLGHSCSWCRESELFPLAQRSRIYEILGYV